MNDDERARYQRLLDDPAHADSPLRPVVARLMLREQTLERRLERMARLGDGFFRDLRQTQDALRAARQAPPDEAGDAADYVRTLLPAAHDGPTRVRGAFAPTPEFHGACYGFRWLPGSADLALYFVDVEGHGLRTALLAMALLGALGGRKFEGAEPQDPARMLAALNRAFPAEEHGGLGAAVWYGVYAPAARELRYAATGGDVHAVAAMRTPEGATVLHRLPGTGPLLGSDADAAWPGRALPLGAQTAVALYSQGAATVRTPEGARVTWPDALAASTHAPASAALLDAIEAMGRAPATEPRADAAALVAEFAPPGAESVIRASTMRASSAMLDDEEALAWIESLLSRGTAPTLPDLEQLARGYVRLTRRLAKISRISDAYQAELRHANRALEEANSDLREFAGRAAHDLKSPLGSLLGIATLLADEDRADDPELVRTAAREMAWSGAKMLELIDALLLLAEVRQREDVPRTELDLGALVAECTRRLEVQIREAGARITQPDAWPACRGYGPWVESVCWNYLSNAIKYGGARPAIELGAAALPEGGVRVWVRDHGPGLDDAQRARLFRPFTRLHRGKDGHGLGLTIVRRVIERLGGTVGVAAPDEGRGSCFFFTLPA